MHFLVLANIGHCNWQDVPKFAETKVRDLLRFIFPNENLDNARDIISRNWDYKSLSQGSDWSALERHLVGNNLKS